MDMENAKKEMQLSGGWTLEPQSLKEAMGYAKLMSDSDLVPAAYKGKPGNVLIAVQMGAELGVSPMQSVQNIAVINGKPGIYGDIGKAILLAAGFRIEEDDIEVVRKNQRARCKITRPNGSAIERTFSLEDAKTAGLWSKAGPWTQYPWRQMAWRAFWFAARDGAADILKGMRGAEELLDIDETRVIEAEPAGGPRRASETKALAAPTAAAPAPATPPPPISPAPAPAPEPVTGPADQVEPQAFAGTIKDVTFAKLVQGGFDYTATVEDKEGPIFIWTRDKDMAKRLNEKKGTQVRGSFRISGDRNELVAIE
jgi:hypothetical protein